MAARLLAPGTVGILTPDHNFFRRGVFDATYSSKSYEAFSASSDISANPIIFALPEIKGPQMYLINEALLSVRLHITDSQGNLPHASSQVAFVNNIIDSIFEAQHLSINGNF